MRHTVLCRSLLLLTVVCPAGGQSERDGSQLAQPQGETPYSLSVSVNEVGITFQAFDAQDVPVSDLKSGEVDVFDNGRGPGRVVSMTLLGARPLHVAFLLDASGSVGSGLFRLRAEAQEAAQKLISQPTDEGTAASFRRSRRVVQSWTGQASSLVATIGRIGVKQQDAIDGTGVFDAIFTTCFADFGKDPGVLTAKVILLFSDGEDTASFVSLRTAIDRCRENHVAVYALSPPPAPDSPSSGPATLRQLTEGTGGRLLYVNGAGSDIGAGIRQIRADLHNDYFLLYRPAIVKHDGSFHTLMVVGPKRVATVVGVSGFYAPAR